MSGIAVAAHEQEHVRNEQRAAHREDREIIHQSVTLIYDCCPECGKNYVSGGTTRTSTRYVNSDFIDLFKVGAPDRFKGDRFSSAG
jgi:hypothetical protein